MMVLEGIRVLDFGRYIAGPFCGALLADMGAEVIRIEKIDGGEDRFVAPVAADGSGGMFMAANRNKKGMTLNPMKPEGREIVKKLVAGADLVIANMPLSALKQMGLDYESLKATKEDIILVMMSAFGAGGPYADRVGFDTVAQAMSGAMFLTGDGDKPVRDTVLFEDYGTSMFAAYGAMCALFERQKSGQGQCVDCSLQLTGVNLMNNLLIEEKLTGKSRQPQGNRSFYAAPADTYKTADGWVVISVVGNPIFKRWTTLVDRPDLLEHPSLQDDTARAESVDIVDAVMIDWCLCRTNAQVLEELDKARIPCGPVYNLSETLNDPQAIDQGMFSEFSYPGTKCPVPVADTPVRLSRTPGSIRTPAPTLGQDTDEIMTNLGYDQDTINRLHEMRVI